MIMQTIAAAHDAGYLHGMVIGGAVFGVIGTFAGFVIAALLHASALEPPAPTSHPGWRDTPTLGSRQTRGRRGAA